MWKEVWIVVLVLAFILLVIAVVLTFIWDIPNLIDELSGRKAKRQIKMLQELNSSTGTFDKLSTNEIYSGISSGTLLNEELGNIDTVEVDVPNLDIIENKDTEEDATTFLSSDSNVAMDEEPQTSYIDINSSDEESTSFLNDGVFEEISTGKIKIIEEQSSL